MLPNKLEIKIQQLQKSLKDLKNSQNIFKTIQ